LEISDEFEMEVLDIGFIQKINKDASNDIKN
jgi:hypothetical protein